MKCKEFVIDETSYGECVECLHEEFVRFLVVLVHALCSEVEKLGHLPALVVSPQHVDGLGVVEFERVKEEDNFYREGAPIHIVTQEEVLCLSWVASYV